MLALLLFSQLSFAQTEMQVPDITVLGTNTRPERAVPTVGELSGSRLSRKKKSTLGETLSRETGVTSTFFGPNASRPVIRGLEGDRIRVLQNGMGVLDASGASQDHAVAADTLNVERIEIVRGPAALLYGPTAIGGVVNMVTNRIPEKVPEMFNGKFDSRYSSTDDGRAGALSLNSGVGSKFAVHADGTLRSADDYHVPGYARTEEVRTAEPATENEARGRAYNSYNKSGEYSLGGSYVFENGFVGLSYTNYASTYGTVAERHVHINMQKSRYDLSAEVRDLGWVKSLRLKDTYSNYKHDELENGNRGTTFKNDGNELRLEAKHAETLGFVGTLGAQHNMFEFEADGDEAFLPASDTSTLSFFLFEEKAEGRFKPSFGLRADNNQINSTPSANFPNKVTKYSSTGSASLGFLYQLTESLGTALNLAYTERAPNYQELLANGAHVATKSFEVGNADLSTEKSQSAELSLRHKTDAGQGAVSVFLQDFEDFIALAPTGGVDAGSNLPIYNYGSVDARFYGAELEYRLKAGGQFEIEAKVDYLRGLNRSTGDNLPRVTPFRESLALIYKANSFQADVELQRSERQKHTAPFETRTDAYNLLNAGVDVPVSLSGLSFTIFGRVNNILDEEARNHVSIIKDLAPLPGRSFSAGLQASF